MAVFGVNTGNNNSSVISWDNTNNVEYPSFSGTQGGGDGIWSAHGVSAAPTFILSSPSHEILMDAPGGASANEVKNLCTGAEQHLCDGGVFTAGFTVNSQNVFPGSSVTFTDMTSQGPTTWSWTFDGGTPQTSNDQNPVVTYNTVGTYDVTLTASNGTDTDSETKTGYIIVSTDIIMGNMEIETCSGTFYDPGGQSADYDDNLDYTLTLTPDNGGMMQVVFTSFNVEDETNCNYDYLSIYDGPSTSSTLIGKYCGTDSPGTVTSTDASGALTFFFHSDVYVTEAGWVATVGCTVGLDDINSENNVTIYPVPSTGLVNIIIDNIKDQGTKIVVQNILGEMIYSIENAETENTIDMSEMNTGTYFARIIRGDNIITKKIVLVD